MSIEIVLVEPEIPQNTGNIARTCVLTGTRLHLVEPLGFSMDEKTVKRAGLDYWGDLKLKVWSSLDEFLEVNQGKNLVLATTKGKCRHSDYSFPEDSMILFGKETAGLPMYLIEKYEDNCVRIPMVPPGQRSLNLSNAVAIVLYEVLRQHGFPDM